jgi:hypothetical protein
MALVRRHSVALVASCHLHKAYETRHNGTRYICGPASSFLVGPQIHPAMPGEKRLGAVLYKLDGTALEARIVAIPGLSGHWIDDVIDKVYPRSSNA